MRASIEDLETITDLDKQPMSQVRRASRPSAEQNIRLNRMHRLQVYQFEKTPGGDWVQSGILSPTAALSEVSSQTGKLSAAFKDKLALFKGHTSHVGTPCHLVCYESFRTLTFALFMYASGTPQMELPIGPVDMHSQCWGNCPLLTMCSCQGC